MEKKKLRTDEGGFSLLEIMVVIALLALLLALVGPPVYRLMVSGQSDTAKSQIKLFEQSLEHYRRNCGRLPTTAEGLQALISPVATCKKWDVTLKADIIPDDPWGRSYLYYSPGVRDGGHEYEIISQGPDENDESDDITSYTKPEAG